MPNLPDAILIFGEGVFTKEQLIMTVFAVVMIGASVAMIRQKKSTVGTNVQRSPNRVLLAVLGLVVGFIAGFVGAGGGFLIIPALVVVAGMPMSTAVGTSLLIISANSLFGFGGDLLAAAPMDWPFLARITLVALIGIFAGSYAARFVPAAKLKPAFG